MQKLTLAGNTEGRRKERKAASKLLNSFMNGWQNKTKIDEKRLKVTG